VAIYLYSLLLGLNHHSDSSPPLVRIQSGTEHVPLPDAYALATLCPCVPPPNLFGFVSTAPRLGVRKCILVLSSWPIKETEVPGSPLLTTVRVFLNVPLEVIPYTILPFYTFCFDVFSSLIRQGVLLRAAVFKSPLTASLASPSLYSLFCAARGFFFGPYD